MVEIIPSINVTTFAEVQERIAKVESYTSWCHLDVTDGVFSKHLTWNNPADLERLQTKLSVEVHLMIEEPENVLEEWLVDQIKRVIVHYEATDSIELILEKCRKAGKEIGVAIKPGTDWKVLEPLFGKFDLVQVLAVEPGPAGQGLTADTFEKIRAIREACPDCVIEIDGGMNLETARLAAEAGANLIVSASYLFSQPDIKEAIENLSRLG